MSLTLLSISLLAASAYSRGDIAGTPVPTLDERFAQSQVVALARIVSGEPELYGDQVYKARVIEPMKGVGKEDTIYFWAGNIGAEAYGLGEVYLLLLRSTGRRVGDAHVKCCWSPPESRFPQDAVLYDAVCPHMPIPLRYKNLLDARKAVFFVAGGCVNIPETLSPQKVGSRGDPFLVWVAQDPLLAYLRELAAREAAKSHAGA